MEITTVTFRRQLRKTLAPYEHDERTCELTARVEEGEAVEDVLARLYGLADDAISGEFDDRQLAPERALAKAPPPGGHPDLTVALSREQIDAAIAAAKANPPPLTEEVFRAELARIAKAKGACAIINGLKARGLERAGEITPDDRRAFVTALEA